MRRYLSVIFLVFIASGLFAAVGTRDDGFKVVDGLEKSPEVIYFTQSDWQKFLGEVDWYIFNIVNESVTEATDSLTKQITKDSLKIKELKNDNEKLQNQRGILIIISGILAVIAFIIGQNL